MHTPNYIQDLDTPTLIIDLDGLGNNLKRYQEYFDRHNIGLRPHIKTHKSLAIAHLQLRQGAIGITCQKLGEAEVMAAGGVDNDILIPFNIIGAAKLERLTRLARRARLTVMADSAYTVDGLSQAAHAAGIEIGVIIELENGRTGVETPQQAVALGQRIDKAPGLALRGIMVMPAPPTMRPRIQEALAAFDKAGLPHPIVSGGSTPCAFTAHQIPELTEYRAGEYPTGGMAHLRHGTHTVEQCALRVLATVVSRPTADRAILDAGSKSLSAAVLQTDEGPSMGHIIEFPAARLNGASEEHGHVDVSGCTPQPQIGDRVHILPVHPCPTVNEHDQITAVRGDRIEAVWPIDARGRIR